MQNLIAQASNAVRSSVQATSNQAVQQGTELVNSIVTSLSVLKDIAISIVIVGVFYMLGKLLSARIISTLKKTQGETLYKDMIVLIRRFTVIGSLFIGIAVAIQFVLKLDFIQVIGFFGLGISFAFKDLLSNLIAGAVIILQNRFHIGDFIMIGKDGIKGKIMEIQTRATILKAIDGTEIIVPNADLIVKSVTSYTAHHSRRIDFVIGISFDADLEKARTIGLKILEEDPYILKKPTPQILVKNIAESSVELNARFWIDPQNKEKSWIAIKSERIAAMKAAFDREGIVIPFPIRTLKGEGQMKSD